MEDYMDETVTLNADGTCNVLTCVTFNAGSSNKKMEGVWMLESDAVSVTCQWTNGSIDGCFVDDSWKEMKFSNIKTLTRK